jgi:hypothetical protein
MSKSEKIKLAIVLLIMVPPMILALWGSGGKRAEFVIKGQNLDEVYIELSNKSKFDSFDDYLEAVKNSLESINRLDNKEKILKIWLTDKKHNTTLTKEEWDGFFQVLLDSQHKIESINFDRITDLNTISGIGVLSEIPEFRNLHIDECGDADLSVNFPDMPNIINLDIPTLYPDIPKHFPNLEEIYFQYDNSPHDEDLVSDTEKAIITYCKNIRKIGAYEVHTSSIYNNFFDETLREEFVRYLSIQEEGIIDGKFTVTNNAYGNPKRGYLSESLSHYINDDGEMYVKDSRECDYYLIITAANEQYYGTYEDGTEGYSRDYYIQIFDVENKVKYKKVFIATINPPPSILSYYNNTPGVAYGEIPDDKILAFINKVVKVN